ncbi:MAG TPA: hypothetical protein VMV34_01085 [Terriglobia bacterium]|nr:hypothetical protein [Terriglobia bacterium]
MATKVSTILWFQLRVPKRKSGPPDLALNGLRLDVLVFPGP